MQVIVDSLLTTYHIFGKDKPNTVLILHGWGDNSVSWLKFAGQLASDYQVVVLDLPGFGKTDMPHHVWGLDDYAAFVASFLQKIDLAPYAIVGHSNGGAIAIRGLATGAIGTERLVLLASAGIRTIDGGRKRLLRVVAKAGKVLTLPLPSAARTKLRRKLYTAVGSDLLVAEHMQETFKRVVGQDVQSDAAMLSLPVLLAYGEDDTATPPVYGRLLHQQIDGSTLEILGGATHFLHLDKPQEVLALTKDFLA